MSLSRRQLIALTLGAPAMAAMPKPEPNALPIPQLTPDQVISLVARRFQQELYRYFKAGTTLEPTMPKSLRCILNQQPRTIGPRFAHLDATFDLSVTPWETFENRLHPYTKDTAIVMLNQLRYFGETWGGLHFERMPSPIPGCGAIASNELRVPFLFGSKFPVRVIASYNPENLTNTFSIDCLAFGNQADATTCFDATASIQARHSEIKLPRIQYRVFGANGGETVAFSSSTSSV